MFVSSGRLLSAFRQPRSERLAEHRLDDATRMAQ